MDQVLKTVGDWAAAMVLVASVVAMAFAAYWREPFFPGEAEVVLLCGLLLAVDFVRRCWNEPSSARRDAWSVAAWVGLTGCVATFAVDGGLSDKLLVGVGLLRGAGICDGRQHGASGLSVVGFY